MIGVLIVFFTIVQSLIGSPHLFQSPRSWWKIILVCATVLLGIVAGYNEFHSSKAQEQSRSTIDSLQGESGALNRNLDSLRSENRDAHEDFFYKLADHDKNTIELLAKYGYEMDSMSNRITRISTSTETLPTLAILNKPKINIKEGDRQIVYVLRSLNSDSYLIDGFYVIINIHDYNGAQAIDKPEKESNISLNSSTILPKNASIEKTFFVDRSTSSTHFVLAIEYLYKSKGDKIQSPLIKLYEMDGSSFVELYNDSYKGFYKELKASNLIIGN
jgi:hypothetical protein